MEESGDYSGCVYAHPVQGALEPISSHDLCRDDLGRMNLVGKPIYASHNTSTEEIGTITDEWNDPNGGKHISFGLKPGPRYQVYHEGIKSGLWSDLSLGHVYNRATQDLREVEVSICHKGARPDCLINRGMTATEYKNSTLSHGAMDDASANNAPAPTPVNTAQLDGEAVPPADNIAADTAATEEDLAAAVNAVRSQNPNAAKTLENILLHQETKINSLHAANADQLKQLEEASSKQKLAEEKASLLTQVTNDNVKTFLQTMRDFQEEMGSGSEPTTLQDDIQTLGQTHPAIMNRLPGYFETAVQASRKRALKEFQTDKQTHTLAEFLRTRTANQRYENRQRSNDEASTAYLTNSQKFEQSVQASAASKPAQGKKRAPPANTSTIQTFDAQTALKQAFKRSREQARTF